LTNDEAVAGEEQNIILKAKLNQEALPWGEFLSAVQEYFRDRLARAGMKVDASPLL